MAALRVVHQFEGSPYAAHAERAARVRAEAGANEVEVYRSIDCSSRLAVLERWADEAAFAAHVDAARRAETDAVLVHRRDAGVAAIPSEIYVHQTFRSDRIWLAGETGDAVSRASAVAWPARGAVRIVLQLCLVTTDALLGALRADQEATRLEPGCRQYEWVQSAETPEHVALLELWDDQQVYDHHWHLRLKTGPQAIDMNFAERTRGANGIEFYRHQPFTYLYDRWLPADQAQWSETVVWPA